MKVAYIEENEAINVSLEDALAAISATGAHVRIRHIS